MYILIRFSIYYAENYRHIDFKHIESHICIRFLNNFYSKNLESDAGFNFSSSPKR